MNGRSKNEEEQAKQIKTLTETIQTQQLRNNELATKNKQLVNEVQALKASLGGGEGNAEVLAQLQKKDELLSRMKREAKTVIDTLKAKHAQEMEALRKETQVHGTTKGSNPASTDGPTAHVAALTTELQHVRDKLVQSETKLSKFEAKCAELETELERVKEESEVQRAWSQADLEAEKVRADDLQEKLQEKEDTLARFREETKLVVQKLKSEKEAHETLKKQVEELVKEREGAVARMQEQHQHQVKALEMQVWELRQTVRDMSQQQQQVPQEPSEGDKNKLEAMHQELQAAHEQCEQARTQLQEAHARLQEAERIKEQEVDAARKNAELEVERLRSLLDEAHAQAAHVPERDTPSADTAQHSDIALRDEITKLTARIQGLEAQNQNQALQLDQAANVEGLLERIQSLQAENVAINQDRQTLMDEKMKLMEQLAAVPPAGSVQVTTRERAHVLVLFPPVCCVFFFGSFVLFFLCTVFALFWGTSFVLFLGTT